MNFEGYERLREKASNRGLKTKQEGDRMLPQIYFLAFFFVVFFFVVVFFFTTGFFLALTVVFFLFTAGIIVSLKVNSQKNDNRFFSITEILFYPNFD